MAYLTAAVVLVGLLCLLDLVLTLGVIRRLREHTKLLSEVPQGMPGGLPDGGVQVGETVADFETTTTSGETVSQEQLSGRTLVGFFAPGCQPCAEMLPKFVEYAGSMSGDSQQVLAVVIGGTEDDEYVGQLAPVAKVVAEEPGGPVQAAFQVSGYPTVYLVDPGGVVAAGGLSMAALESVPGAAPTSLAAAQAASA